MIDSINVSIYRYILEVESFIFMRYKIDPFSLTRDMTLVDLQFFIDNITNKIEDENKNNSGNKVMKSLAAIRDILIGMSLPQI